DPADHYQCYEIKPAALVVPPVTSESQFGPLNETLRFPHRLCAPANKNNEGILDPTQHLVGYSTKVSTTFTRRTRQTIDNQFGPDQATLIHRRELCVPSLKNPTTTTTSSTTTTSTPSTSFGTSTTTSSTSTTLYGSPSRAFLTEARSLLD